MNESAPADGERWAWLAFVPLSAAAGYYALPQQLQALALVQFVPQISAYAALVAWAARNDRPALRLGLAAGGLAQGWRWGLPTGLALGTFNVATILWLVPALGADTAFLRETPHAQAPLWVMLPWFIVFIALFVELNFRGFLLGRLAAAAPALPPAVPIVVSALAFSFDPFMVATFKHLHWIAAWDGLVWGWLWVRSRNLFVTIVAHAVEVVVMYSVLKLLWT